MNQETGGQGDFRFIVATDDFEAVVAFYRDKVGFELYRSWDRPDGKGALLRAAGGTVEIVDAPADSPYAAHRGIGVGVETDDVEALCKRLKAQGVQLVHDVITEHGFRLFRFVDPTGVVVMPFKVIDAGVGPGTREDER